MKKEVAVIGIGITQFGELWDESFRTLFVKSGAEAIQDAGIKSDDIDIRLVPYLGDIRPFLRILYAEFLLGLVFPG